MVFFLLWSTLTSASFFLFSFTPFHSSIFYAVVIKLNISSPFLSLSLVFTPIKSSQSTTSSSVSICTQATTELQPRLFLPLLLALLNMIPLLYFPICCLSPLCFCASGHVDNNKGMQVLVGWFTWYTEPLTRLRLPQMLSDTASSHRRSSFPWVEFILARAPTITCRESTPYRLKE